MEEAGTRDSRDEDKGSDGVVKRWLDEIDLAEKRDKDWQEDVKDALKIYSGRSYKDTEHTKRKEVFNIFWSNVETKAPALYNSTPRPDIRPRFVNDQPIHRHVAEVLERAVSFAIDEDFDEEITAAVNDMLISGRGVTRIKYVPTMSDIVEPAEGEEPADPTIAYQEIQFEQVQWDDFQHGPAKRWKDVPWISFRHKMIKDDVVDRFGQELADKLTYSVSTTEDTKDKDEKEDKGIFKQVEIYEIWDKFAKSVIFIAPCYKDKALEVTEDPLGLQNFWPIPRPLYAIDNPASLIPATEYSMYETLARELETLTVRIGKIIDGLRLRGVYDSTLAEIEKLFDEQDNGFIPAEDVSRLIEGKGLSNAIWMLPIKEMAEVLQYLYQRREAVVQEIYQITGISDIMRGATNPHETLGAQQIKSNFGTQRLQKQQRSVQRYIRDTIRIVAEMIAENFSPEVLAMITGLPYLSAEQKALMQQQAQMMQQQAQMAMQQAQMQGQKPQPPQQPPQDPRMAMPTWDDITNVLQSDLSREFSIDIETDSTIQNEQANDEERITKLLTGIMNFMDGMAPAVQQGIMPVDAAKKILKVALRRFKFGREMEEAVDAMGQQQQKENPEDQAAQMEMQAKQMEMQAKQAEMAHDQKMREAESQVQQAESQMKMQQLQLQAQIAQQSHQAKLQEMAMQQSLAQEKHRMEMQRLRETPAATS